MKQSDVSDLIRDAVQSVVEQYKLPAMHEGEWQMPEDFHMRGSSNSGIAEEVYRQLLEDYPKRILGWVRSADWYGPLTVDLDMIDFTNKDKWQASEDTSEVDKFEDKIENEGFAKPIILVNEPNYNKLRIVDGHHRALAYKNLDQPAMAYVANVGSVGGDWDVLHDRQRGSKVESSQQ